MSAKKHDTSIAGDERIIRYDAIPGPYADGIGQQISNALELANAPASIKRINYAHLTNAVINLATLSAFWTHIASSNNFQSDVIYVASIAMAMNLLGLAFDNAVLALGRPMMQSGGGADSVFKALTKARVISHSACVALLAMPIMAVGWDNGLFDSYSIAPWFVCSIAAAALAVEQWINYDVAELTEVHNEAIGAHDRGVWCYTTGKVMELVAPCIGICLLSFAIGGLSVAEGAPLSGMLLVGGSTAMMATASLRVHTLDNYAETLMLAALAAALVVSGCAHPHDVLTEDMLGVLLGI